MARGSLFRALSLLGCSISIGYSKCLNDCMQHGLCSGPGTDAFCICEPGWTKDDCSERLCPKGDDPDTPNQEHRMITISTDAKSGTLGGHFDFTFMGHTVGFDAASSLIGLKHSLEALPPVSKVDVQRSPVNVHGGANYTVTFLEWPKGSPPDNNLYSHDGVPPLGFFKCTAAAVTGASEPTCKLSDYGETDARFLVEYVICSNHGTCNPVSGKCKCDRGYRGEACSDNADAEDLIEHYADGPFFSGAVMRLKSARATHQDFDYLAVEGRGGNQGVLTLSGEGDLLLHSGKMSLEHGNLSLSRGDIEVANGGVHVSGGNGVAITAGGPRTSSATGGSSSSGVARGLSVSLMATDGVDSELAALGFGGNVGGSNGPIGVSFEHQALLIVGAPPVTMADLMGSEGGDDGSGFDYVSIGPMPLGAEAATPTGAQLRRQKAYLRVAHNGLVTMGNPGMRSKGPNHGGLVVEAGPLHVRGGSGSGNSASGGFSGNGVSSFGGELSVGGGLQVNGSLGMELQQGPLVLRDGNALIRSPTLSQPALTVAAVPRQGQSFTSSVLALSLEGAGGGASDQASFMQASRGSLNAGAALSEVVFEVDAKGGISSSGGVRVSSGGVQVAAGGVSVASGGLNVHGGLTLQSGVFEMASEEGIHVSQGGLSSTSSSSGASPLVASASNSAFRGSVFKLDAAVPLDAKTPGSDDDEASLASFNFLEASRLGEPIVTVDGNGQISAKSLQTQGSASVKGSLNVQGPAILGGMGASVAAGDSIVIDPCAANTKASFVRITSDNAKRTNALNLKTTGNNKGCQFAEGQLLIVYNGDEDRTTGDAEIPAGKSVLFVYSAQAGPGWVPLTTLDARSSTLDGITKFTAAANLDLGPFSFKAQQLVAAGQEMGQVALYGPGGLLVGESDLSYASGTLSVPSLNVQSIDSSGVDFMGSPLTNVRVQSGSLSGLSAVRTKDLFVESLSQAGGAGGNHLLLSDPTAPGKVTASTDLKLGNFGNGPNGKELTLMAPSLRLQTLTPLAGSLALVGDSGAITGRSDVQLAIYKDTGGASSSVGTQDALRPAEVSDLARQGVATVAELRAPRMATNVLSANTGGENSDGEVRMESHMQFGGKFELRGATIVDSSLAGLDALGVTWLTVRGAAASSLAYLTPNQTLASLPGAFVGVDGVAHFDKLGVKALGSDLDCKGHTLSNVEVRGGALESVSSVSAASIAVTGGTAAAAADVATATGKQALALLGRGGSLEGSVGAALAWDPTTAGGGTLHVPNLGGHQWGGHVNARGFELQGAKMMGGSVTGVAEVLSSGGLGCQGDLDVFGDGSVGGTLVVGGTVMGSGPYVDSSDARLKQNVRDLFSDDNGVTHRRLDSSSKLESAAINAVRALRPVRYSFNASAAPNRTFPRGEEVGFLAQEVEAVLPELVTTSPDGFKGLAYARFTPVLASAVTALARHADSLSEEVDYLRKRDRGRDAAVAQAAQLAAATATAAQEKRLNAAESAAAASVAAVEALTARLLALETALIGGSLLTGQKASPSSTIHEPAA